MNLYLFDEENIVTFTLPNNKIGNFWMTDNDNKNIVNIRGENGQWIISGNETVKVHSSKDSIEEEIVLKNKEYYYVLKDEKQFILYSDFVNDSSFEAYSLSEGQSVSIGKSSNNQIYLDIPYLMDTQFILSLEQGVYKIKKLENALIYLNNEIIKDETINLKYGDIINTFGFKIILVKGLIFINNPRGIINIGTISKVQFEKQEETVQEEIINKDLYKDDDYYLRSPRMRRIIETLNMSVDSPPAKELMPETPLIMTLAPMLAMGASSMITISNTLQSVTSGEKTLKEAMPSLIISGLMIFSMLIWPFINRAYEKRRKKKKEKERQKRYKQYLDAKKDELELNYNEQKRILEESLLSTDVCYDTIINRRRTLWGRKLDQGDFLTVRIGKGQIPFDANISYHTEDFTMDDDNLKKMLDELIKGYKTLTDVPVGYSFTDNHLTAINGIYPKYYDFIQNLILQMMSYHSYDNLKIVIFTNKKNEKKWDYLKDSPYCFSNEKDIRFFATNTEEMQELSNYLKPRFNGRQEIATNGNFNEKITDFSRYVAYYLLIVDDINLARKIGIIDDVLEEKRNLGYSLIVLEEKLSKIPSEISKFITIGEGTSIVLNSENNAQIRFNDEIKTDYDMNTVVTNLSNLPVYVESKSTTMPNTITFLELFSVGQIEQLNVLNRWKENNPVKSLKTEIGVNENGDTFILDLHEKAHGPHGLVAGMTGSGKSEFIITYVLSMATNYSPEEVAFVLIDYKGGGLAGAFVNSETGEKLPHVVGTITNLDKAEINRALSSIQSELRRRQTKFNEVRDKLGESTIDIYKYQKLYRDGVINEPIPHLIIVCDEFAELKDQQPDFMDDLISTARIGRSLGVHLILATQKPSGVVDAQIWSNSKFKICLKVQDKSDSMEMIKTDLAAELKNVGRFYLQVGYNEFFAMGQSAWAGAQYFPSKEFKKTVDKNLYFINNVGLVERAINNSPMKRVQSQGEELTNIVKYLINIEKESNFKINQLWLDKIPSVILVQDLYKKYNYAKEKFMINPIIGEYDDPSNQFQGLLTMPITKEGSLIVYGTADSGKDEFLSTFVYSCLMTYDTSEVNFYLLDFGAETLMNYESAPQVGNVILNGDDEKLENLSKMLNNEMNKRKKLFMSYNGNYEDYLKLSGKTLPNIIVVINSIEVLNEMYQDYIDKITSAIREGSKYGINFVITTVSPSTVKFKVAQSCKQMLCLQMNNETDYKDILGKTNGLLPFNSIGRGLIKLDRVVEFQTAFLTKEDSSLTVIKELINALKGKGINKAKPIPVMPEIIEIDRFKEKYTGINSVPLGLTKETLVPSIYDYSKSVINLISSNEMDNMRLFIINFIKTLEFSNDKFNKVVIDASNYFDEFNYNIPFSTNNFNNLIDQLVNVNNQIQSILEKNNMNLRSLNNIKNYLVVIIGTEKFMKKLDDDHKDKFKQIINQQKEALKINFIFIDMAATLKKYEYEDWYKNNVDANNGLWIGMGVTQQYVIKLNIQPNAINNIENDCGVVIKNGMPLVIKFINQLKINVK